MTTPGAAESGPGGRHRLPIIVGWGAYLACSWTWCIGMFLPVLLTRDYGPAGFLAFALPNVLGAAGMGWVLRTPGSSERLVERHGTACAAFSIITAGFQVFFLLWLSAGSLLDGPGTSWHGGVAATTIAGLLVVLAASVAATVRGLEAVGSLVVFGGSVLAAGVFLAAGGVGGAAAPSGPLAVHGADERSLLALAPVCVLGFALCPYLDLTFHRALRATARQGLAPAAFAVGFGVLFFPLIFFTLLYGPWLMQGADSQRIAPAAHLAAPALAVHMLGQLVFTTLVHVRSVKLGGSRLTAPMLALALGTGGFVVGRVVPASASFGGLGGLEVVYRCFMAFYGLVFPAYVWLCVIPHGAQHTRPTRRGVLTLAGVVGVAAPMFWMGFVERRAWWLVPGLLVVLGARLLVSRAGSAQAPSTERPAGGAVP